ncbi:EAL domain-containing protein [Arthrobacter oryzae]|uniref:EAL domain-containing protein n=1 Tax=Arthrobacter oryzae TaxID=409290 RepID=A0A3N0C7J3_9MICC|nr:EAL domain-containing protein [Arthrobacter oryzae]RNL59171.1 EAL domain-containing protein [Arthrobacter oryzae]
MTGRESGTPRVRDVLVCVLVVQVVFALTAGAALILDPGGILAGPAAQWLAGLVIVTPVTMAIVLAERFRRGHRAERTHARHEAQLMDTVLSTSHEWVWAVNDRGLFTFSSPASAGLLGWEPAELIGQRYDLVIDAGDLARAKVDVAAATGPGWSGVVIRCRHRDGSAVWMDVSGMARPPTEGRRAGFEGTSRVLPPLTAREAIDSHSREQIQRMIDQNMLLTAFQPIQSLSTGKLLGVEALARFVDEDGAGTEFWFTEAAVVGLLGELEFAALETALATAPALPPGIYVALNISPETCLDPRLPGLLQRSGLPLTRIVLELTERLEVTEYGPLLSVLAPLRAEGLRIAVDDAGSGFASMRHVLRIRPDIIKLDRSLIAGIDDDQGRHALGAALLEFARQIGATLVAEGIETPEELAAVAGIGMTAGQGYLIGRPSIHPQDWAAWNETSRPGPGTGQP